MIRKNQPVRRKSAFTLVEVMIAATLSTLVLAGVLSAFLMVGRTSFSSGSYSQIEAETRRALEIFGVDARRASDIHWNSSQSITLTLPTATSETSLVTYAYDNVAGSPTTGCFYSLPGDEASAAPRQILARNVAGDFAFQRFRLEPAGGGSNEAADDLQTKQLQVSFHASVRGATTVAATQTALSACHVLRNKRVSN